MAPEAGGHLLFGLHRGFCVFPMSTGKAPPRPAFSWLVYSHSESEVMLPPEALWGHRHPVSVSHALCHLPALPGDGQSCILLPTPRWARGSPCTHTHCTATVASMLSETRGNAGVPHLLRSSWEAQILSACDSPLPSTLSQDICQHLTPWLSFQFGFTFTRGHI